MKRVLPTLITTATVMLLFVFPYPSHAKLPKKLVFTCETEPVAVAVTLVVDLVEAAAKSTTRLEAEDLVQYGLSDYVKKVASSLCGDEVEIAVVGIAKEPTGEEDLLKRKSTTEPLSPELESTTEKLIEY